MTTTTAFRRAGAAAVVLATLATACFVVLRDTPARAHHGAPNGFNFSTFEEPTTAVKDSPKLFSINLNQPAAVKTIVMMEIEGGQNDPETGDENTTSYDVPEAFCEIEKDSQSCSITYTFTVVPVIGFEIVTLRFYISHHTIDTQEGPNEDSQAGQNGCVTEEPDTTEAVQVTVSGAIGGTAPARGTRPPGVNTSYNCENPEPGGGGPGPTQSDTGTPSPTQSDTGTPSPTQSDTGTPSPTQSDTGTPSPTQSDTGTPVPTSTGGGNTFGQITIGASPSSGVYGTDPIIGGTVTCNGLKATTGKVLVIRRFVGSRTTEALETAVDANGRYAVRDTDLRGTADYSAVWNGEDSLCSSGAETGNVHVRAEIWVGVIANVRDRTLRRGDTASFYGAVVPGHAGKRVQIQVYHGDQKRWIHAGEARLSSRSHYAMGYRKPALGWLIFRICYPTQDLDHRWNCSRSLRVDWS